MQSLFFVEDLPTQIGSKYTFDNDDALHASRVLRVQAGDTFILSDGSGAWSQVQVRVVGKKSIEVEVLVSGVQEPLSTEFTVVQAVTKGERIKECIELLTEGGADRIVLWNAQRSIGKGNEKLQVTAREASKQSRRFFIPKVEEVVQTLDVTHLIKESDLALVFHESAVVKISEISGAECKKVLIIVGPEGGLTDLELETFTEAGAKIVHLGRPVLRSAHAGIAALASVSTALKVW